MREEVVSKKVANKKFKHDFGWKPEFTDIATGLKSILNTDF